MLRSFTTRRALAFAAIALAFVALPQAASAQKYPERPVRLVLPLGAAGVGDITARIIAERLGDKLGQRFVVENMPGPGGIVAGRAVLSAPADGYTLLLMTGGIASSVPLYNKFPLDMTKDFVPISSMGYFDCLMVVNAQSEFKTLGDFLKIAREKPGKLNVGTISAGGVQNLTANYFKQASGADFVIVPFRTTPDAIVALLRNDVEMVIDFYAALKSGLEDNKLRAVAWTGPKPSPALPDVPTALGEGRERLRGRLLERALRQGRHAAADPRDLEQGNAGGARRARREEASARPRHRFQGQHAGRDGRADARRHHQVDRGDRPRGNREALSKALLFRVPGKVKRVRLHARTDPGPRGHDLKRILIAESEPCGPGPRLALAREFCVPLRQPGARLAGARDRDRVRAGIEKR